MGGADARPIGITAIGTVVPETEMSVDELAALNGIAPEHVRRVIGTARIHVSTRKAEDFAVDAARRCLARAALPPEQVGAIIFCNGSKRRTRVASAGLVQDAIGAHRAFCTDLGHNCSELLMALRFARSLLADSRDLEHVLLVSGEAWEEQIPRRTIDPMTEKNHQNVMSDGGCAVLVARTERSRLTGFGFASMGKYWDLLQARYEVVDGEVLERAMFKPDFPSDQQLALDLTRLFRLGLERCLEDARLTREAIDHVVLPFSGLPMQVGFARALGLDPKRIVHADGLPTHIGAPDIIHAFELLLDSGQARPGARVLMAARSVGLMRCAMIEL